jgi:hypothetical protein
LDTPAIPGLSIIGDLSRYHVQDSTVLHEVEWAIYSLCQAAGMPNTNLRQWFIYPLVSKDFTKSSAVKVQVSSGTYQGPTLFGTYNVEPDSVLIPDVTTASWEKAFYGVENDKGFSDPRYDSRLDSVAATSYDIDLSPAPGMQTGRYNIHLLAGPIVAASEPPPDTGADKKQAAASPAPAKTASKTATKAPSKTETKKGTKTPDKTPANNAPTTTSTDATSAGANPSDQTSGNADTAAVQLPRLSPAQAGIILSKMVPLTKLQLNGQSATWAQTQLPQFTDDMWVIRVSGDARVEATGGRLLVNVAAAGPKQPTYQSPWSAPAHLGQQWSAFDTAVPIQPGTLPVRPDKLLLTFAADSSTRRSQSDNSPLAVELRNVRLQIWRLPTNPIGPGHIVF